MLEISEAKIAELQNHRKKLVVELEGFQDLQQHDDLPPAMHVAIAVVIAQCEKQLETVTANIATQRAAIKRFAELGDTDYPELPRLQVTQALKDIFNRETTGISVANAHVDVLPQAVKIRMRAGQEIDKN